MAFTIPNQADVAHLSQADPDKVDFDILAAGAAGTGVVSGCEVTAQGTPDMTVAVAAGIAIVAGVPVAVDAGDVAIDTADATDPRFDLIAVDAAGTKSSVAGNPAPDVPVFSAIPADSAVLAAVYVPAGDTTIGAAQIVDKRVIVPNSIRTQRQFIFPAETLVIAEGHSALFVAEVLLEGDMDNAGYVGVY
jgi:hypothetical protein